MSNMNNQHVMNGQHILYNKENNHNIPLLLLSPGEETALAVFIFVLDGITVAGRSLVEQAIAHPWVFGISAGLIVGGVLFLTIPVILGFAETGPVSGSLAALWQSWIGNVMKGSLFAIIQSLSMTGVFDTMAEALLAAGIAGGGIGGALPVPGGGRHSGAGSYRVGGAPGAMVPAAVIAAYFMFPGV